LEIQIIDILMKMLMFAVQFSRDCRRPRRPATACPTWWRRGRGRRSEGCTDTPSKRD